MYIDFDNYLLGYLPMDYWYDEGFSIARDMISKFTQQDWAELLNNVLSKSLDYQKKLAYCIENSGNEYELNLLLSMINTDDEELFEICVDSLREFADSNSRQLLLDNDILIGHIDRFMSIASEPAKKVCEDFLRQLSN